jgi:DegV family protein with EDD domain
MIKIVTDSTSDISSDMAQSMGIKVVPLYVHFGDRTYRDGVDLTSDAFYSMLSEDKDHPTTTQPTPEDFKKIYSELLEDDGDIISIHLSSKLSGTVQSAQIAQKDLSSNRIHIVDSGSVSIGLAMIVAECVNAVQNGKSVREILDMAETLRQDINVYFIVDTLEYLQKGGRIGMASALIGSLLHIKPILTIRDGVVAPFEKVRGTKKAFAKMCGLVKDLIDDGRSGNVRIGFCYAADNRLLNGLKEIISGVHDTSNALVLDIGPVVGTHGGPGTLAVSYFRIS